MKVPFWSVVFAVFLTLAFGLTVGYHSGYSARGTRQICKDRPQTFDHDDQMQMPN